jgi:hypothetical protein
MCGVPAGSRPAEDRFRAVGPDRTDLDERGAAWVSMIPVGATPRRHRPVHRCAGADHQPRISTLHLTIIASAPTAASRPPSRTQMSIMESQAGTQSLPVGRNRVDQLRLRGIAPRPGPDGVAGCDQAHPARAFPRHARVPTRAAPQERARRPWEPPKSGVTSPHLPDPGSPTREPPDALNRTDGSPRP